MALIDFELERANVGIAALQEVRLSGKGYQRKAGRTFYWRGCKEGEPRISRVAFAIEDNVATKLGEAPKGVPISPKTGI